MKQITLSLMLLMVLCACGSDDGDSDTKDMTYPVISDEGIVANPTDCQQYKRGDVIPFNYIFTDNQELGWYNIKIHNNFDHHTHSTGAVECPMDEDKKAVAPWVFDESYNIPAGQRSYTAKFNIDIPAGIDPGDYHFMIRVTDRAGWQQLRAVAIKITE